MPQYRYQCDECSREHLVFHNMDDPKPQCMCPYCWGPSYRQFSTGVTSNVFKEYQVAVPSGEVVHVKTAAQDRDIPKLYGICKATSDEIGCTKKKGIKMRPFAEDYARHAAISMGQL